MHKGKEAGFSLKCHVGVGHPLWIFSFLLPHWVYSWSYNFYVYIFSYVLKYNFNSISEKVTYLPDCTRINSLPIFIPSYMVLCSVCTQLCFCYSYNHDIMPKEITLLHDFAKSYEVNVQTEWKTKPLYPWNGNISITLGKLPLDIMNRDCIHLLHILCLKALT